MRLSYSRVATFLACRKMYYWIYEEGLVKSQKSVPLQVGDLVHTLLESFYRGELTLEDVKDIPDWVREKYPENSEDEVSQVSLQAAQLVGGYLNSLEQDKLRITSPELHLEKDYGDFSLYTRVDGLGKLEGDPRLWRIEHKTTSRTDSIYLQGLRKGLQTGISYWLLEDLLEEPVVGTIFNLLVKTKVPSFPRMPCLRENWVVDYSKQVVEGVYKDIKKGDFYPSLSCSTYRECDYLPLCRARPSNLSQVKEAFFLRKNETKNKKEDSK